MLTLLLLLLGYPGFLLLDFEERWGRLVAAAAASATPASLPPWHRDAAVLLLSGTRAGCCRCRFSQASVLLR